MGSIARVRCHYVDLLSLIENCDTKVYAATLDGNSHYQESFPSHGLLVMGSESHGISDELLKKIENRISILLALEMSGPKVSMLPQQLPFC